MFGTEDRKVWNEALGMQVIQVMHRDDLGGLEMLVLVVAVWF
jgi:hypothetical protein